LFNYPSSETTYFAFSYPFSFEESTEMLDRLEERLTRPEFQSSIYFHREVLFYSLEGRKMEIFTISSRDHITEEQEDHPDDSSGLYPESQGNRPLRFERKKRTIFFTGRVHPGESPASHMLNGALNIITE
jgi:hypothetical protein